MSKSEMNISMPPVPQTTGRRLEGKRAIVTGAGSRAAGIGNGRAAAILFALEGACVLLVDRDLSAVEETQALILEQKPEAIVDIFEGDVTDEESCAAMVRIPVDAWGGLDVLHNNVGVGMSVGSVVDSDLEQWDMVQDVNVRSMVLTCRHAVPAMIRSDGGSIINVSSIAALRPRGMTAYSTSKGAVIALSQAMAADHAREAIRVNCIAPGPMYTPMVYAGGMNESLREARRDASMLGIEGTGWDIGLAATFLASDESRYITGVVLPVDGGVLLRGPAR
ncbi:MAG: short-chain dehydrogenase [Chloroflexi bacterium]|nr:short-chain dehydrogenase [Chloroflexota bacterium]|tara:strand:+ start:5605 stop:6441 length:837 start_codon:yes stop_codon:yes gene_type:complete